MPPSRRSPHSYPPDTEAVPQDRDGQAYIAYFDSDSKLGFVWDGTSNYISVCYGGMGEVETERIVAPAKDDRMSPIGHLLWFEQLCKEHIDRVRRSP